MFSSVSWSHLMSTIGHFSVLVRIKLIFRSKWLASCSKVAGQFYIYTVFSILFYSFYFIELHFNRREVEVDYPNFHLGSRNEVCFIPFFLCGAVYTHLTCTILLSCKYNHLIKVWCDQNYNNDNVNKWWLMLFLI